MGAIEQLLAAYGGSTSLIKSIQQVTITIAANATSNTATISSVVTGNACRFYGGVSGPVATPNSATCLVGLVLTNSTTVTATRNTADASNAITVVGTIVEFASNVIQSMTDGSITMTAATSNTATIGAVTTTNSAVVFGGSTSNNTTFNDVSSYAKLVLTNSTTVTATRITGTGNLTINYTVIEFKAGILNSNTQAGSITMTTLTSNTATISNVNTANSMLLWNGFTASDGAMTQDCMSYPYLTLTNGTTVTAARGFAGITTLIATFSIIEFKASAIKSMNRGALVVATSATSNTATISAVNTAKCIANHTGQTNSSSVTGVFNKEIGTLSLTNSTTLTAATNTADTGSTRTFGYEAIEFA